MREARRRAGTARRLAEIASAGTGRPYSESAAFRWTQEIDPNLPSADVLVAVVREWPALSFDAIVRGEVVDAPAEVITELTTQIDRLESTLARMAATVARLVTWAAAFSDGTANPFHPGQVPGEQAEPSASQQSDSA